VSPGGACSTRKPCECGLKNPIAIGDDAGVRTIDHTCLTAQGSHGRRAQPPKKNPRPLHQILAVGSSVDKIGTKYTWMGPVKRRDFIAAAASLSAGTSRRATASDSVRMQNPPKPSSRAAATEIIANARKIVTPNDVGLLEALRIDGIDQWVSVRGACRSNPVLLHVHGGPGYISIPMSWWFSRSWEEYFTVVQWDQLASHSRTDAHTRADDR
jgi:hypothetical protein